jgi:uncharacterized protein YaaQ
MKKILSLLMICGCSVAFAQTTQTTVQVTNRNTNNGSINNGNTTVTTVVKQEALVKQRSVVSKNKTKSQKNKKSLGVYEAVTDDFSLMVLMYRWAETNQKSLHWDTLVEVTIDNPERFNEQLEEAGVNSSMSLKEAMTKTLKIVSVDKPTDQQLKVCPFTKNDSEIIVRPIQLPCN